MIAEEVFVNCYNFYTFTRVKKGNFQNIFLNYPEPGQKSKLQFVIFAPRSRSRKNHFRLHNSAFWKFLIHHRTQRNRILYCKHLKIPDFLAWSLRLSLLYCLHGMLRFLVLVRSALSSSELVLVRGGEGFLAFTALVLSSFSLFRFFRCRRLKPKRKKTL